MKEKDSRAMDQDNERERGKPVRAEQGERPKNGFFLWEGARTLVGTHFFLLLLRRSTRRLSPLLPPSASPWPLPLVSARATAMKATDEKKKAAVAKQTPKQRQRSLLESLGIVPGAGAAPARPPKSPPLVVGKQRSLDGLAKVVRKRRDEGPRDVLSRCLGTLGDYQRAAGGGGAGDGGAPPATATEDQARAALRELSCVRVDASLMISSGAGAALRRFRKDPGVAVALCIQAQKILEAWREAVTSEVRAGRRSRARAAAAPAATAAATAGGGGT